MIDVKLMMMAPTRQRANLSPGNKCVRSRGNFHVRRASIINAKSRGAPNELAKQTIILSPSFDNYRKRGVEVLHFSHDASTGNNT